MHACTPAQTYALVLSSTRTRTCTHTDTHIHRCMHTRKATQGPRVFASGPCVLQGPGPPPLEFELTEPKGQGPWVPCIAKGLAPWPPGGKRLKGALGVPRGPKDPQEAPWGPQGPKGAQGPPWGPLGPKGAQGGPRGPGSPGGRPSGCTKCTYFAKTRFFFARGKNKNAFCENG